MMSKRKSVYISYQWQIISVWAILLIFPCGGIFSFSVRHVNTQGRKAIYNSAKKYSLFHFIWVSSWSSTHLSSPCNLFIIFTRGIWRGKKKISALVKMGNRCSNNDWRQLMFLGRSKGLDLCSASDFYSKQTQGKCKCEIKVLFSRQRKTVLSDCIVMHFCYDLTV